MARKYANTRAMKPYADPQNEREDLQNQLWSINVSVPGSSTADVHSPFFIELEQLRDIVQAQWEKVASEPEFRKGNVTEEGREGFRSYLKWRERREMGVLSFAMPGIPGQK